MYGPVRTVVWQGSAGDRRPYADQVSLWEVSMKLPITPFLDSFRFGDHSGVIAVDTSLQYNLAQAGALFRFAVTR